MKNSNTTIQFTLTKIIGVLFLIIAMRLFQLQILSSNLYTTKANNQHLKSITLPAQRGEILSTDYHTGNTAKLATNTTLDMLYIDPYWIKEPDKVVENISPIIYQSYCSPIVSFLRPESQEECSKLIHEFVRKEYDLSSSVKSEDELKNLIKEYIKEIIDRKEVTSAYVGSLSDGKLVDALKTENIEGLVEISGNFYINPTHIRNIDMTASKLSPYFPDLTLTSLKNKLERRPLRYIRLARRLDPEISNLITSLKLSGVVLVPEYWRFYPEKDTASQTIGFVDHTGKGTYGIEEYFDEYLKGQEGSIKTENDTFGRNIATKSSTIKQAQNGASIHITIDRIVQKNVENLLKNAVEQYDANSAQAIVVEVETGKIIVMANYPNFDPNFFGDVYKTINIDVHPGTRTKILENIDNKTFKIYENRLGPESYANKIVSETYEPGSIFKSITISTGIDQNIIDPQTPYYDAGDVKVDEFTISNVDKKCIGQSNVLKALIYSCNVGLTYVSNLIGKRILYSYISNLGFGDKTGIKLPGEASGNLEYFRYWPDSKLATTSFGQGLTVTPLQMAQSYLTIANKGIMIRPYVVDKILYPSGYEENFTTEIIGRIFNKKTTDMVTAMLVRVNDEYTNRLAQVPGYYVAGKTGTSQIASKFGGYEEGIGTTITSFAGFLPAYNPKFVVITKVDRPRSNIYANSTAAPLFSKIGSLLMNYYNIPKDIN